MPTTDIRKGRTFKVDSLSDYNYIAFDMIFSVDPIEPRSKHVDFSSQDLVHFKPKSYYYHTIFTKSYIQNHN